MNIFYLNKSPVKAAKSLCLSHLVKMPTETLNILLIPFKLQGFTLPNNKSGKEYKISHVNHPASIWARESQDNYNWLFKHASFMIYFYECAYKRMHFAQKGLDWIQYNYFSLNLPDIGPTNPARCFSDYKESIDANPDFVDTVEAYREFYRLDKKGFAKWPSINNIPDWWIDKSEKFVSKSFVNGEYTKRKVANKKRNNKKVS